MSTSTATTALMDIDKLKKYSPFYAGAGVAGVALPDGSGYHFYTAKCPRLIDDLHSHKRSYTSTVIRGTVRNHLYAIKSLGKVGGLMLVNTDCELLCGKGGCAASRVVQRNIDVVKIGEEITNQGESYSRNYYDFHKFELVSDGPVITYMQFKPIEQNVTQIIVSEDYLTNKCCPQNPTEDELWEMVQSTLTVETASFEYEVLDGKFVS